MCDSIALNRAVREKGQLGALVSRELKYHERKAKLKDNLKCYEAREGVVIALLRWRQEACNQQDCREAGRGRPKTGENREGNGAVKAKPVLEMFPERARFRALSLHVLSNRTGTLPY